MSTPCTSLYKEESGVCIGMHFFSYFNSKNMFLAQVKTSNRGGSNKHLDSPNRAFIRKISQISS